MHFKKNILLFCFKISVLSQLCKRSFSAGPCLAYKCLNLIPSAASGQLSLLLSFPWVTAFIYLRCAGLPTIPFEVVSLHKKQAINQELLPKGSERRSMALKYSDQESHLDGRGENLFMYFHRMMDQTESSPFSIISKAKPGFGFKLQISLLFLNVQDEISVPCSETTLIFQTKVQTKFRYCVSLVLV